MLRRARALALALSWLALPVACSRSPAAPFNPRAPCASLDPAACRRARALVAVAGTYADEEHDFVLATLPDVAAGAGLVRAPDGWRRAPVSCATPRAAVETPGERAVSYSFVGVAVDATVVSADADLAPLLDRATPPVHDVRLVAIAFLDAGASPTFTGTTPALVATAVGEACTCASATHFAGARRLGAMVSFALSVPRRSRHVRALDLVRAALDDPGASVHEAHLGAMTIDGLEAALAGARAPLTFHVQQAVPVAFEAAPLSALCDFPAPEVSPSPLDFGVAPYGTLARRTLRVVNRSPFALEAALGAGTFPLPAYGAIDLPLTWTPDGDAPGCETQTRDLAISFLRATRDPSRASAPPPARLARVLETIRTGRPTVERAERLAIDPWRAADAANEWSCPPDFHRSSCTAESAECGGGTACARAGYAVVAEPRGENSCQFGCRPSAVRPPAPGAPAAPCHFVARMACALQCTAETRSDSRETAPARHFP